MRHGLLIFWPFRRERSYTPGTRHSTSRSACAPVPASLRASHRTSDPGCGLYAGRPHTRRNRTAGRCYADSRPAADCRRESFGIDRRHGLRRASADGDARAKPTGHTRTART